MPAIVLGLAMVGGTAALLRHALARKEARRSITGLGWLDEQVPLVVVSGGTIGAALVLSALVR